MIAFSTSLNVPSLEMESKSPSISFLPSLSLSFLHTQFGPLTSLAPLISNVLSGSYNNYFHIYDQKAEQDIVLQADKSAFKAKKIGANKAGKGGAGAAGPNGKKGAQPGNGKPIIDTENIDFNKKILHGESL